MTLIDVKSKHGKTIDDGAAVSPVPESIVPARRRVHIGRFLVTLATVALAGALGLAAWAAYMGAPWTRDATVRAYVVTMAPEVAGRIVELPVADNQYVRKGDLLMTVDPTNYTIAASQAEAAVQQAHASIDNIDAQIGVQQAQINAGQAAGSGPRSARVRAATSRAISDPGEGWLRQCSECSAIHIRAASAGGRGADRNGRPQPRGTAGRVAKGATHDG